MSIANEFDSTIENIKSDYEGLENIGADLTNVNKNIQNIRTCLDTIYDNLPKTTGEGSNLSLTTLKGRINVEAYKGDTTQEGTPTPSSPQDTNVVTGTQEVVVQNKNLCDGQFRQGGWHDRFGPTRLFTTQNLVVRKGTTLTISTTLDTTRYKYGVVVGSSPYPQTTNPNIYDSGWNTTSSKTITFNVSGYDIGYLGITIATANGTDSLTPSDIASAKWQVEYGSTATSYTEHQEQTKTLHLSSKNLCNLNLNTTTIAGVTLTKNSDNTITANGTATSTIAVNILNNNGGTSTDNLTLPKGTYTLSGCPSGGGTSTNYKLDLVRNLGPIITDTGTSATYTATSDIAYSGIRIVIYNGTTCDNLIFKPMLEEGSTAHTYEPYYNYELCKIGTYQDRIFETSGKQMLNVTATSQTKNNIVFTINNGVVKANGTGNSSKSLVLGQVQLEAGKTYYLSGCASGGGSGKYTLSINAENDTTCLADDTGSGASYTPSTSGTYDIKLNYWYNYAISNLTFYPMLNEGSTALPYEPYGSDKWYIEKNIYKIANKTNWVVGNVASNNRCPLPLNSNGLADTINNYNGINCISNCLIATSQGTQATSTDINTISINNANAYVKFDDATNTKELVKAKLDSMTNFVLYYILKTPTYTEITNETLLNELNELEKMMSYNGQTNISVSGNLPMILDVSALKGE